MDCVAANERYLFLFISKSIFMLILWILGCFAELTWDLLFLDLIYCEHVLS